MSWPAPLSVEVSWRRHWDSVFPPSFPPTGPSSGARLPSTGSPGTGSPASSVLLRRSDSPPTVPPCSVAIADGAAPVLPASLLSGRSTFPEARGLLSRFPSSRVPSGAEGVSQVPGEPTCEHALALDPGGASAPGLYGASVLPSAISTASASANTNISGLYPTACPLPVYASPDGLPRPSQHSVPATGQAWLGGIKLPTGFK
jgi:hypothetical protein